MNVNKNYFRNNRAFRTRLFLKNLIILPAVLSLSVSVKAADDITAAWAFYNDGSLEYEDNASSWYSSLETVCAVAGIDINLNPVRQQSGDLFSRECVVALIDTGVDTSHEALAEGLWENPGEIPDDGIDNDGNGYIDDVYGWNFYNDSNVIYNSRSSTEDAHGTHCAGTIIANAEAEGLVGIAGGVDSVRLMCVKTVGGTNSTGSIKNLIKGIQYAEENGAVICNISLGMENYNEDLYQAMKNSKMLFVTVAGNGTSDTHGSGVDIGSSPTYPACYDLDNMIVVSNLKCDGTLHYSSNYSSVYVDIAAPGTKIYSTSTYKTGYEVMTGTSMSAPMVTGAVALVYASHEDMDIYQVKQAILESAVKLDALEDTIKTGGMLDVAGAVFNTYSSEEYEGTSSESEASEEDSAVTEITETESEHAGASETSQTETESENIEVPETLSEETGDLSDIVRIPEAEEPDDLNVVPSAPKITKLTSVKERQLNVKWKKVEGAYGYKIVYATNRAFTRNKRTRKTTKTSITLRNLKQNRKWYVKVCAYTKQGTEICIGTYSKVRRIRLAAGSGKAEK